MDSVFWLSSGDWFNNLWDALRGEASLFAEPVEDFYILICPFVPFRICSWGSQLHTAIIAVWYFILIVSQYVIHSGSTKCLPVGCIYAHDKVNPNIFQFYFIFRTFSITHPCIHSFATFMNFIWFLTILFHLLLSTKVTSTQGDTFILIPFGAGFANTFPHIIPGVEIRAVYEIIVSHAPEQGICVLNHAIPTSPPQCLTVTEGVSLFYFSIIILLIKNVDKY